MTRLPKTTRSGETNREEGAALVLALVFVLAVSLIVVALATLATGSMTTSSNLKAERTSSEDAETAVTLAMQWVRYDYVYDVSDAASCQGSSPAAPCLGLYTTTAEPCTPPHASIPSSNPQLSTVDPVSVWCTGSVNPLSSATRTVYFSACAGAGPCSGSSALLNAQVNFDDQFGDGESDCNLNSTSTCGENTDVVYWDVVNADT